MVPSSKKLRWILLLVFTGGPLACVSVSRLLSTPPAADSALEFDESVRRVPGDSAFQMSAELSDLSGAVNNNLCFPSALGLELRYQRQSRVPRFPDLAAPLPRTGTVADWTRYLATRCQTDRDGGTPLAVGIRCINSYYREAGYRQDVAVIGERLAGFDDVAPAQVLDRGLEIQDFRAQVGLDQGMILTTGYYVYEPVSKQWLRLSGHSVLVKGYVSNVGWRDAKIFLSIVNPAVNYDSLPPAQRFDRVIVEKYTNPFPEAPLPRNVGLALYGPTFDKTVGVHLLEDLVVFRPGARVLLGEQKKTAAPSL